MRTPKKLYGFTFQGYPIEKATCDLTVKEIDRLEACCDMISDDLTVRQAADKNRIKKSTLHRFIRNELPDISGSLHQKVLKQIEHNIKTKRGRKKK